MRGRGGEGGCSGVLSRVHAFMPRPQICMSALYDISIEGLYSLHTVCAVRISKPYLLATSQLKKLFDFPVPSRGVIYHTLPGREL